MPRETAGAGFIRTQCNIRFPIGAGAGLIEYQTDAILGHGFTVEKVEGFVVVAGTGAGATRLFRVLKGAATVVASATVALADTATVGAKVPAFTIVTADADFLDASTLTVDSPAAGAVAYTAGELALVITLRQRTQQR